jgi:SnoaL-like polyketide cyclase
MSPKRLIERFYHEVWNRPDEVVAREILHPEFCFRGSLGEEKRGPDGFITYLRMVHAALSKYTCTIEEIVEEGSAPLPECDSPVYIEAGFSAWNPPAGRFHGLAPLFLQSMATGSPAFGCLATLTR